MRLFRLIKIVSIGLRFGLYEFAFEHERTRAARRILDLPLLRRRHTTPRAVRLRRALEALGPIFVKFGQVLSTRRDLLPPDIADELALLQDRVPPFPIEEALAIAGARVRPAASTRCSRVRSRAGGERVGRAGALRASCRTAREVAVKVLRPGIAEIIENDLALMRRRRASLVERLWRTASACGRARSSPSSTSTCTTSST